MRAIAAFLLAAAMLAGCAKEEAPVGDWVTLKSGVRYRDITVGTGETAVARTRVSVLYKGWLDDGKVFDASSRHRGEPFTFTLGSREVIQGWDEGIQGMKAGGKRELVIPPETGYGSEEQGTIPPNSTLHFEVELQGVEKAR